MTAPNHMSRILIVSSAGGHLDEVLLAAPELHRHEVILVVNERCDLPAFPFVRVYRICHAERDWKVAKNFAEAASILLAEDPDFVLSAGAGPAVPFAILAKALGRAHVVFIETAAAVTEPSLTGRLMYWLADDFFYQWKGVSRYFPRGQLLPLVFP
jgi:beta-1,4-N-acetylglucosaminyltransferase